MSNRTKSRVASLTPRQREVVRLVSLGCRQIEIAAILGLAPSTVENHRTLAMKRLGVSRVALLTRLAIEHRISPIKDKLTPTELRKMKRRR